VIGALAFKENINYGHVIEPQLEQVAELTGWMPETALVDRGCKGNKNILGVRIKMPGSCKGKSTYQKARDRQMFRRRASIEPIIGHIKQGHKMLRNYLKGTEGYMINTLLAATASNMVKILRKIRKSYIFVLNRIIDLLFAEYQTLLKY